VKYPFREILLSSIKKTNQQIPDFLGVLLALALYALRDFLVPGFFGVLLLFLKTGHKSVLSAFAILPITLLWPIVIAAAISFIWVLLKYDGALGLALAYISIGEKKAFEIASKSQKNGLAFFWNALMTGVLLIFGQMLLICPCFLFRSNFVFSPFLFVYENIRGLKARNRSRELAAGFGWMILNRTAAMILVGYIFLIGFAIVAILNFSVIGAAILVLFALYLALVQSNYVRNLYEQALTLHGAGTKIESGKYAFFLAIASIAAVLLIYVGFHYI